VLHYVSIHNSLENFNKIVKSIQSQSIKHPAEQEIAQQHATSERVKNDITSFSQIKTDYIKPYDKLTEPP